MACPKCFSGHKHDGETLGKEEKIHGLDTYVTEGINPKAILIYVPDAFGWKFNNARILADHYASRIPARVYVAEFMDGNLPLHLPPPSAVIDKSNSAIKSRARSRAKSRGHNCTLGVRFKADTTHQACPSQNGCYQFSRTSRTSRCPSRTGF